MKNLIDVGVKALLTLGIVILFVLRIDSGQELVYVDSKKLVLGYKGMDKAKSAFELKASQYKSNLDTLRQELEQSIQDFNKRQSTLKEKERKEFETQLQTKQQNYLKYEQTVNENLKKEDEALTVEVMGK